MAAHQLFEVLCLSLANINIFIIDLSKLSTLHTNIIVNSIYYFLTKYSLQDFKKDGIKNLKMKILL